VIQSETVEDDRADQGAGRDVPVRGIGGDHGLIMHPAAGVLVYVISALATHHSSKSSPAFIVPLVMCVLLAVQVGAIKVARTKSGTAG
jgi:hypothetical protein